MVANGASLLGGQASLATYVLLTHKQSVAFWNILFFVINCIQIARILRARRPIRIPADRPLDAGTPVANETRA